MIEPNANLRYDDAVKAWTSPYLDGPTACAPPIFGSAEWAEADDRVKVASTVRAAVAWYLDADAHRLAVAVEAELEAFRLAEERDYAGWRRVARRVRALADEPSHEELRHRRSA